MLGVEGWGTVCGRLVLCIHTHTRVCIYICIYECIHTYTHTSLVRKDGSQRAIGDIYTYMCVCVYISPIARILCPILPHQTSAPSTYTLDKLPREPHALLRVRVCSLKKTELTFTLSLSFSQCFGSIFAITTKKKRLLLSLSCCLLKKLLSLLLFLGLKKKKFSSHAVFYCGKSKLRFFECNTKLGGKKRISLALSLALLRIYLAVKVGKK